MKSLKIILGILILIVCETTVSAQTQLSDDSISLHSILKQVISNYPAIKKSEQELNAADARIGLAKSAYYPDININSNYTRIGPVSSMTLPGLGTFSLFPVDNYSSSINYNQTIYDFGKSVKNIAYENQNKEIANLSVAQLKQKLSLAVINCYYSYMYLIEAVTIKEAQLATLKEHLLFIEKKAQSGSATPYEVLTTKVRISAIENQKTDLLTAIKVRSCQLNSLLGKPENAKLIVKKELQPIESIASTDSLLTLANQLRIEIQMAKQKMQLSELYYKTIGMQNNPVLNFSAASGIKNGYTPDIKNGHLNYSVSVGLKIPVFDANRSKYTQMQAKAEIESNKEDVELIQLNIVNEVIENQANISASLQKITQSELQLQQAQKAYNLAETSYKSGVITNLELLDSSTSLSEVGLLVLKTKIDYSLNLLRLKITLGLIIY